MSTASPPELQTAMALLRDGNRAEATKLLTMLVRDLPGAVDAIVSTARAARQRQDQAEALACFEAAAALAPGRIGLMAEAGHCLLALGHVDSAEDRFNTVLNSDPADVSAMIGLGHVAERRGNLRTSLGHLQAAAALAPHHVGLRQAIAHALIALNEVAAAEVWLQEAHALAPDDVSIVIALAETARRRDDRAASRDWFEQAARLAPDRHGLWAEAAHDLLALGRAEAAENRFRAVLALDPQETSALIGLGQIASSRGDHRSAITWFEQAAASAPAHSGIRTAIGHAAMQLGRLELAETHFGAAIDLDPRDAAALCGLAAIFRHRGDSSNALRWFEAARSAHPGDTALRMSVAECLLALDRAEEAYAAFQDILAGAPENLDARLGLARAARRQGNHHAASRLLTEAAQSADQRPETRLRLADALNEAGEVAEARRLLDAVLQADPGNSAALLRIGRLDQQAGDWTAALECFRHAASAQPDRAAPLVAVAIALRAMGEPEQSAETLDAALDLEPNSLDALLGLADHAALAGDHVRRLHFAQRAAAAHEQNPAPIIHVATALHELGRGGEAQIHLDAAVASLGSRPELIAKQAEIHWLDGDWSAARATLDQAGERVHRELPLWMQHLRLCLTLGDHAGAEIALLDPPARMAAEQALAWLFRGQLAEAQWRLTDAFACYAEAARLNPNDAGVEMDLARVCLMLLSVDQAWMHQERSLQLVAAATRLRGHSARVSQSHLGHIGNELRLDSELAARLRGLMHQAPQSRLEWMRPLLPRAADTVSVAMATLITLRQTGLLHFDRASTASLIPRRITQFWDDPDPPADVAALMTSWSRQNPAYDYRRFDDRTARRYLADARLDTALAAYDRAEHPAQKSDLFRLAVLLIDGGIWADADDLCRAGLSPMLAGGAEFVAYQEIYGTLGNNVLAAVPGHPIIARALELASLALTTGDTDVAWLSTGPGLLSRAFVDAMQQSELAIETFLASCRVLERSELAAWVACHRAAEYKRTDRHWLLQRGTGRDANQAPGGRSGFPGVTVRSVLVAQTTGTP